MRSVITESVCAQNETNVGFVHEVRAGADGGSRDDILAYLRDANPFTPCAYLPSAVSWDLTLTTPRGTQVYNTALFTQRGESYLMSQPQEATDVAFAITRVPSGIVVKVK